MPGTRNNVSASLRELRQQRVTVCISDVRGVAAANKKGRVRPGGDGFPAHNMRILIPQHRDVKAPLPVNKRFQQELDHAFFIKIAKNKPAGPPPIETMRIGGFFAPAEARATFPPIFEGAYLRRRCSTRSSS